VGVDGGLTIEVKPDGLLGVDGNLAQLQYREGLALLEPRVLAGDRQWTLITARVDSHTASR